MFAKISITNPWARYFPFKSLFEYNKLITKNKFIEIEIFYQKGWRYLFEIQVDLRLVGHDHAGFEVSFNILGFECIVHVLDKRHWNHHTNAWYTEEDYHADELAEEHKNSLDLTPNC